MASVALITVHGMGNTARGYAVGLKRDVADRLGTRAFKAVSFGSVYYQDILKPNEQLVWDLTRKRSSIHYEDLRKFLLFGFADAAGLESRKEQPNSTYELAQIEIAKALLAAQAQVGNGGPVVFITQSLGGQVLSNYLYDAQQSVGRGASVGIWRDIVAAGPKIADGRALTLDEIAFLRGSTVRRWLSTGCNIPIFVAAHKTMTIIPIAKPTPDFKWLNIFDPDDVLGWPLGPLSPDYAALVEDRSINAGNGAMNWILKSWNPLSHTAYWEDGDVLDPLVEMLREFI